ncbi:hypothetical protein CI109_107386 [Kwoniella shandongensis]|uniref:Uncharacterized protein n=1 Tax=Kwoniella shandongensis TaxID=1734106 RepID=A0A5M6BXL0_9TREE|nr:uncharacterized protein CI109_004686 [Kwoniella shandongensis]KAA5526910.1 hypothetical protein CI109_004686 [Kwoniella shandongensis]
MSSSSPRSPLSLQPIPQQPHWTEPPPSPPTQTPTEPIFSRTRSSISETTAALASSLHVSAQTQPIPLPTPSPSGPSQGGLVSPPTPAPSPSPKVGRVFRNQDNDEDSDDDDAFERRERDRMIGRRKGKGVAEQYGDPHDLLGRFNALHPAHRFTFLSELIGELRLNEALVVSRKIEPLLRRDFLRELPLELALNCLSFVDDPQTLARAAQVSRYWNTLLQDEQTWKDLFDRHGFPPPSSFVMPTSNSRRRSARTNDSITSIERKTPFGDERRVVDIQGLSRGAEGGGTFKTHFKNAYLTESNWLSGGRMLAAHESFEESVVTTLCFDEQYIIIGMANNKIHVFDAPSGSYRHSLLGHEQGVWAMVLVSTGATTNPTSNNPTTTGKRSKRGSASSASRNSGGDSPPSSTTTTRAHHADPYAWAGYGGRASGAYRDEGQSRRSSFNGQTHERIPPLGTPYYPTTSPAQGGSISTSPTSPSAGYFFAPHPARPSTAMGFTPLPSSTYGLGIDNGSGPAGDINLAARKMKQSDVCGSARGWSGNRRNLLVSGGCDRKVKVWNADTGECIYSLPGHTSTIRCLKVLDRRPIAVSGSRDHTLRVWDIERGRLLHVLEGHEDSVRCVEIAGNMAVSGSYDHRARLWDLDTGECVHVLSGHYHKIYSVAFDGQTIVTGSLDSTIRVWSATTGECLALLQGHTALVGQLQLSDTRLITGGSDGRVIIFDLQTLTCAHRLCAHDNSVTCLQFDDRFIVSGGNDGRVKLWDVRTGAFVRELTKPCDAVWRVGFKGDRVVVLCQRKGKTCLEVISFRPGEGERTVSMSVTRSRG